jgi:hypothetical protein
LCFVFLFHSFSWVFSMSWVTSSLILSIFIFNSFISLFIVFSVTLWCLFRAPMISFICSCVVSYSLFLFYWNFLSASCTFGLTTSSIISMEFSVITCRMSYLRVFLWTSLGCLVSFIFVLLESGIGYPFSSFPLNPVLNYFWGGLVSFPFSSFHHSCYCVIVLDRLLCGFSFLSLCYILFCICIGFLANCVYTVSVPGLGVI